MITFYNAGSGGVSALTIDSDYFFDTTDDRDTYFSTNSDELVDGVEVVANSTLYKYDLASTTWVAYSTVIRGASGTNGTDGTDADDVIIQYSSNGTSGWTTTYTSGSSYYWRISVDGGDTYTDAARYTIQDPIIMYAPLATTDDSDWVTTYTTGVDFYWKISFDGGDTYTEPARYVADNTGSSIPDPYSFSVDSTSGALNLYEDDTLISYIDTDGLWVINEVTTGTGSLHLGDVWSIGGGGESLAFINDINETATIYNAGYVSLDGTKISDSKTRVHGDLDSFEPNGSVNTSGTAIDFNADITVSEGDNICVFSIQVYPAETYSGMLTYQAYNDEKEISKKEGTYSTTAGSALLIELAYPLWTVNDESISISITKEDGTYLSTYPGSTDSSLPYRNINFRTWTDYDVFSENNIDDLVSTLNSDYEDSLSWDVLTGIPYASEDEAGVIKIDGTSLTIDDGVLSSNVAAATKVAVSSESEMLALTQISNLYIVTRTDVSTIYYLNADLDPSDLDNWTEGAYVGDEVSSFNDRTGAVTPTSDDYTMDLIYGTDTSTSTQYYLEITDGILYMVEV